MDERLEPVVQVESGTEKVNVRIKSLESAAFEIAARTMITAMHGAGVDDDAIQNARTLYLRLMGSKFPTHRIQLL